MEVTVDVLERFPFKTAPTSSASIAAHVNHDLLADVNDSDERPSRFFNRLIMYLVVLDAVVVVRYSFL